MKIEKLLENPIGLAIGASIIVGVLYLVGKKAVVDVVNGAAGIAAGAGGLVSGNNPLTKGTPYAGAGVLGTVGSAVNDASGGYFQSIGESLGSWLFDVTHAAYDPSTGLKSASKTVADGAVKTDQLWGPLGSVELRAN